MLKRYAGVVQASVFTLDLVMTVVAFLGSFAAFKLGPLPTGVRPLTDLGAYLWLLVVIIPFWAILLQTSDIYRPQRTSAPFREVWGIVQAVGFGGVGLLAFMAGAKLDHISRAFMAFFVVVDGVLLLLTHGLIRLMARRIRSHGRNTRTALVIGTGPHAISLAKRLVENRHWGVRVIGHLAETPETAAVEPLQFPLRGSVRDLGRILCEDVVDEVFVAVDREQIADMESVFLHCEQVGVTARLVLDFFPHRFAKVEMDDLDGVPTLAFTTTPRDAWALTAKRAMDIVGSGMFLLSLSWLYGLVALAIKLTSRGPVFYRQTRVGMYGRKFTMLKFRSMIVDADKKLAELRHLNEMDGPVFKIKRDPRITVVGRFLRKFSLDEFPQMWNVFVGDMSLVGPRPPIPAEVAKYDDSQRRRLSVRPGLTCLWQISGRNTVNFEKWVELDLAYIDKWSLGLDVKILLKTVPVVLGGRGAS
jgi:exopolysaccharide biosynthesis polyprenyl glycosylphosphotransferase